MIRCGVALNLDGNWEFSQLFDHMKVTVKNDPDESNGKITGLLYNIF